MSLAIYRKYRPQIWSDLTGQNHIKVTLQHEIENNKVAHAYLFTGSRGVGKTTTARLLAKALNCQDRKDGQSEPCNKCEACLELAGGNDMDILEVDAASHTGVDNVRENIIANARFTPVKRKYKVFIIDEVHMLSISAFNALLKILEEPPAHAIFILATTEVHKVPATIISRCQRFDFKKVNADELIKRLTWICQKENVKVSKKVLNNIARVSEGCLRDAESLLGQILSLGEKEVSQEEASLIIPVSNFNLVLELVESLVYKNTKQAIGLVNKLVAEGTDLVQFTDELIEFLRKMILSKITEGLQEFATDLDDEQSKQVIDLAQKFSMEEIIGLINLFTAKKFELKTAVISQLPLEIAIIEYCQQKSDDQSDNSANSDRGAVGQTTPDIDNNQNPAEPQPVKSKILVDSDQNNNQVNDPPDQVLADTVQEDFKNGDTNTILKNENLGQTLKKGTKVKIKLSEIRQKWHSFIVEMQKNNASLVFILKVAEPLELNDNILKIGFQYEFHQQRINQPKVRECLEKILSEFFNDTLVVETCLLAKDYQSDFIKAQTDQDDVELVDELPAEEDQQQKELIDNLVKTFNGKIVE
jgi:DNA polymerase-3 subunit gamma/tau